MLGSAGQPQTFYTEGQGCYCETHWTTKNRAKCILLKSDRFKKKKEKKGRNSDIHA